MVATEQVLEGSCHCGRVRYRAVAPFGEMTNCHCTDCRKSHGAAFATYIEVPRERFSYVQGEGELHSFQAESGLQRYFCRNCGSIIWNGSSNPPPRRTGSPPARWTRRSIESPTLTFSFAARCPGTTSRTISPSTRPIRRLRAESIKRIASF